MCIGRVFRATFEDHCSGSLPANFDSREDESFFLPQSELALKGQSFSCFESEFLSRELRAACCGFVRRNLIKPRKEDAMFIQRTDFFRSQVNRCLLIDVC